MYDPSAVYTVTYLAEPYQLTTSALEAELTYAENLGSVVQETIEKVSAVETDLSGYKLSQLRELAIVKMVMSGKNLLHNWDFRNPVNQRGKSSVSNGSWSYNDSLDRYMMTGSFTFHDDYIEATSDGSGFFQTLENYLGAQVSGKLLTVSVLLRDGTIVSQTGIIPEQIGTSDYAKSLFTIRFQRASNSKYQLVILNIKAGTQIAAWKAELGPVSTLANDPPADFGEQLALCQRFALSVNPAVRYVSTRITSTEIDFFIPTPVTLRIAPTIAELSGGFSVYNNIGALQSGFIFVLLATASNGIVIRATKASHGLTYAMLEYTNTTGIKIISAEL